MEAMRASFKASSLSVLRLTLDHRHGLRWSSNECFESKADRKVIDPSGGSAGFHDNEIDFVFFEDSGEVIPIGCGVEKRVFPSFGVEKAAHGIELTEVESEN